MSQPMTDRDARLTELSSADIRHLAQALTHSGNRNRPELNIPQEQRSDSMPVTSVVGRHLAILEVLAEAPEGVSLGAICARTTLQKSAAHRMLASLIDCGYVVQHANHEYRLTMKLVTLGFRFLGKLGVVELCQGVLQRVRDEVQELVRMTIADRERLVWVAKAQGARGSLKVDPVMGHDVVLHATASGKVWLASLPLEQALRIVLRDGFGTPQIHGPNVIQSAEDLIAELKRTRERGFGIAWQETDLGIGAVAVGISATEECEAPLIGTLSIAGPVSRLSQERLESYVPLLKSAARELAGMSLLISSWRGDLLPAKL